MLYIALGYLLITTVILLRNRIDFKPLKSAPPTYFDKQAPEVSICIPARNEFRSIARCVRSAVNQQYPNFRVFVLDDESTDGTGQVLKKLGETFPKKLTIISGSPKPDNWIGKCWACHQLSRVATGDILIFVDADTRLSHKTISGTVRTMGHDVVDFITLWPEQKLVTFWEKVVIPLVYFALFTLLPVRYVHRPPRWLPPFFRKWVSPFFTAACGQFMAFKRNAYEEIGGHAAVKNNIVEDVELAKNIKRAGFSMNMYHGKGAVSCRMYFSRMELWQGFRKNFFAGFNYNLLPFFLIGILHILVFILPIVALPFLLANSNLILLLCFIAIGTMFFQRFIIDLWFSWNPIYGLFHPLGVLWFQMMEAQVLLDYFRNKSPRWKGRVI